MKIFIPTTLSFSLSLPLIPFTLSHTHTSMPFFICLELLSEFREGSYRSTDEDYFQEQVHLVHRCIAEDFSPSSSSQTTCSLLSIVSGASEAPEVDFEPAPFLSIPFAMTATKEGKMGFGKSEVLPEPPWEPAVLDSSVPEWWTLLTTSAIMFS